MALQQRTELEQRVHKDFQSNLHILTLIYPPSDKFKKVFKENMFVKPNKEGFQQVMYYLLGILHPNNFKQKITSWPIYDVTGESKFRKEVIVYINELNAKYEHAGLPLIQASQLSSPGGFKFIKFMFKLSQFVLFSHLKRTFGEEERFLFPIKPQRTEAATTESLKKFKCCISNVYKETNQMIKQREEMKKASKMEAEEVIEKQLEVKKSIRELELKLQDLKSQKKEENGSDQSLYDQANQMRDLLSKFEGFHKCRDYDEYLGSGRANLEYKKQQSLSLNACEEIETDGSLDLVKMFEYYLKMMDKKRLEFKPLSDECTLQHIKKFQLLNRDLNGLKETLEKLHMEVLEAASKLQDMSNNKDSIKRELIPASPPTGFKANSTAVFGSVSPALSVVSVIPSNSQDLDLTILALPLSPTTSSNDFSHELINL